MNPGGHVPSSRTPKVSKDEIRDSWIKASVQNSNVFRGKSITLLSSFPLCNLTEHSRSSLGCFCLFHICVLASRVVS